MRGCRFLYVSGLMLFLCPLFLFAQNNAFKINDALYDYYREAQNNLKVPGKGLRMADTLFYKAQQLNDLKAQCIALYLRVNYYHNQKDIVGQRAEFNRVSPFYCVHLIFNIISVHGIS